MREFAFSVLVFLLLAFSVASAQRGMRVVGEGGVLPEAPYRTSWALLIGINKYSNLPVQYQLNYAVNDARDLKQVLTDQYQFPESNVITLTDEQATRRRITEAMGQLADSRRVKLNDRVLVYFSGHAQTVPLPRGGEMGFILPHDAKVDMDDVTNPSAYYTTCLAMDELKRLARMIPAKHVLFLIDACYSGLAISRKGGLQPSLPGYLRKVASIPVRQVITAGSKGEESYEKPEWGHGAFTHKLLEALRTGVADGNDDGVITGLELAAHLRNVVPNVSPNQTPQYGYFEGEGEFLFLREIPDEPPPPHIYRLDIASPEGFQVFLDDKPTGQESPTLLTLPAGQYKVRLEKPGYKPIQKEVTLSPDHPLEAIGEAAIPEDVPPPPEEGFGMLYVKAFAEDQPTVAAVFVDGREVGSAPYTDTAISTGTHEVKVSKPLYHDYQDTVTVAKDRKYTVNARLQPAFGSLEVNSTPSGAEVELLDAAGARRGSGTTPFQLAKLPSGFYRLRVSKDRYYPESRDIAIRDGQPTTESLPLKPRFGSLEVKSTPTGASVLLAGKEQGITPLTLEVNSGRYVLELHKELYMDWSGEVDIRDGETTRISQLLPPNFGTLDVQVTPAGSQILVDGKRVRQTPATLKLTPGTHRVEVNRDDYVPQVHDSVFIGRGQTKTLTGTLERKMGTLQVISTPPEARITVDGKDYGLTPNVLRLPTGSYKLKLSKEGFRDYEETVDILWNKAVERNVEMPTGPPPGMVLIPAGEFQMGSNDYDAEKPVHTVYLDDFYMDMYEVTNAQYKKFLDANPQWRKDRIDKKYYSGYYLNDWNGDNYPSGKADHPVVYVSWYAAKAYAQWAGKRLPTEAEWEKAARGGLAGRKYPWGDTLTHDDANYSGTGGKDRWSGTAPVGSFAPNGYGLYDMAGNVWEWCADWYGSYSKSPERNPRGPSSGKYRVLRGGSWFYVPYFLRAAYRFDGNPALSSIHVGFRGVVARD